MELDGSVAKFLEGKSILVTGATGFLAKVFVEKILRLQPNVKKLYLLLRSADSTSASQRLHTEIANTELFRILRENWGPKFDLFISTKVVAIPGDISSDSDLRITDSSLLEEMWREVNIVVNVAATTNFIERYDVALAINVFGALNVLNFAKNCDRIEMLMHVSTAYVCGEKAGLLLEKPFYMGETLKESCYNKLDIMEEKRMVEEKLEQLQLQHTSEKAITSAIKDFGLQRANLYGWPNTYVFTKAMGEMILGKFKGDLPLLIIRPSMIASTYKEPFPGWIEGVRTIDSLIVSYGQGKLTCFPWKPNSPVDVIPVDMVVNAMVVAMVVLKNHHQSYENNIYHVSSSLGNPIRSSHLHDITYRYFTKNPWTNRNGQRIKVGKGIVFSTADLFSLYMKIRYLFPLKVLYLVNAVSCQYFSKIYKELDRKIKLAMRLADLYKPYAFFKGIFDDTNLKRLQRVATEKGIDVGLFNFDPKSIDWEDYIMNVHIPGLSRLVIKA